MKKIKDGSIKTSIKPQQVYNVAEAFDGTGKELIEKFDDRGVGRELINDLELKNSIDQPLKDLSGGELQRIAVAVSASKDADFYFFDRARRRRVYQASVAVILSSLFR